MSNTQAHTLQDGRKVAFRYISGIEPALVFLPGYMSDMTGSKAAALFDWAGAQARACLLLDYSGCGASTGDFADGSLSLWRGEVLELIEAKCAGPVVLVGSSMGGWLMLLVALALGKRLAAIVGIAAAPDFSEWGYPESLKARLRTGQTVFEDNSYGPEPTPTHAKFWRDAQANRLLESEIALDCPVRLLHGQNDADVPWEVSLRLARQLRSDDIQVTLVKAADHRLSRDEDIATLLRIIAQLPSTGP